MDSPIQGISFYEGFVPLDPWVVWPSSESPPRDPCVSRARAGAALADVLSAAARGAFACSAARDFRAWGLELLHACIS